MKHYCFLTGLYSRYDVLMFERQGKSLIEEGFSVTYVVCDDNANEVVNSIKIISTGFVANGRLSRFLHTKQILYRTALEINADIYQISDPELISLGKKLKFHGKNVIFNMREFYPTSIKTKPYIPKLFRSIFARLYERNLKYNLKYYDAIFIVTTWMLDIVKNNWGIKNSYLLTNFPKVNTNFSLSFDDYEKRGNVLCYEGTIYNISRQEKVFCALENLPSIKYLLAGKIDDSYNSIKNLEYWKKIIFIDGFDYSELSSIFAKSSISNVLRDFGNEDGSLGVIKLFESMEAALPVILSDVPLYRFIVEKYHCGICVNPNDSVDIERALRYLVDNKEEAYLMGQNGRKAVIEEFNWENQAKSYVNVINNL